MAAQQTVPNEPAEPPPPPPEGHPPGQRLALPPPPPPQHTREQERNLTAHVGRLVRNDMGGGMGPDLYKRLFYGTAVPLSIPTNASFKDPQLIPPEQDFLDYYGKRVYKAMEEMLQNAPWRRGAAFDYLHRDPESVQYAVVPTT